MYGRRGWAGLLVVGTLMGACTMTGLAAPVPTDRRGTSYTNVNPAESAMVSLVPARLLDTRQSATVDGQYSGIGMRPADSVTEVIVTGRGGVAANASAVALNITATDAQTPGYVTVWPCGTAQPNASNLNYDTGWTIPNAVIAKTGTNGSICLYTSATTHLIADVGAYFPTAPAGSLATMTPLVPARLLETRSGATPTIDGRSSGIGLRSAGSTYQLDVTGRGGVPDSASAVVLNVTVTDPRAEGFITVYPCGSTRPNASSLNYVAGWTIPNAVIAKVGSSGNVCLYTSAATHLIADVDGYFITPTVLDQPSRTGSTGTSRSELLIYNDASRSLHITIAGPETRVETIAASPTSSDYSFIGPLFCRTDVPSITIDLAPGVYDVSFSYDGIRPWAGNWTLTAGSEYSMCFYVVKSLTFG